MKSFSEYQNYRHDIVGKFNLISKTLEMINEENFTNDEFKELYTAIHESLIQMLQRSNHFINNHYSSCYEIKIVDVLKQNKTLGPLKFDIVHLPNTSQIHILREDATVENLSILKYLFSIQ